MTSYKQSRTVGRVTEITNIVPFKKGEPEGVPGVRYADRCRIILEAFGKLELEGFVSPVRRFAGIHFARWTLVDADTRLLFTTNFDGTWEDYIGDFTREIPWSLGLIWCNCVDYPEDTPGPEKESPWKAGAEDYPLFSKWVKQYQVDAGLFYAHYGNLTVRDIRYLQTFRDEATKMMAAGEADLGVLNQRVMAYQAAVERAHDRLPAGPFPGDDCLEEMTEDRKEVYRKRIGTPLQELYPQFNDATRSRIMSEFGLGPSNEPKRG